jgi:hypothetical protein
VQSRFPASRTIAAAQLILLLLAVFACGPGGQRKAPHPAQTPIPPIMDPRRPGDPMYGSFATDQIIHMTLLEQRIYDFVHFNQRLPSSLDELGPFAPDADRRFDEWHHRVAYRVVGDSYELRSAGADGVFLTNDDIVDQGLRGRYDPCWTFVAGITTDFSNKPPVCPKMPPPADTAKFRAHPPPG